ncbi:MAG: ATP-binding cassette domain-containing protein [Alphaproteobacteria bacterium]|nr:ATP-binding cassette domain-containing protein [Alphaproteobacteria bacterium]
MNTPLISFKNVNLAFNDNIVLKDFNLDVFKGESVVILGESGSGKSVCVKLLMKLLSQDSGDILINNRNIKKFNRKQWLEFLKDTSMSFQSSALFDSISVAENIMFRNIYLNNMPPKIVSKNARRILKEVHLDPNIENNMTSTLSGGMRKRVGLARAFADNPKLMIFDEPTSGLDSATAQTINKLIKKATDNRESTTITISHDLTSALVIADRICILHNGKISWQGSFKQLLNSKSSVPLAFMKPYHDMIKSKL